MHKHEYAHLVIWISRRKYVQTICPWKLLHGKAKDYFNICRFGGFRDKGVEGNGSGVMLKGCIISSWE